MFSNGNRWRSMLRIYSSCAYWHAKERMGFLTDSRCRYWFNKIGQSFRIGQIYRVAVKEERSTNESVSLFLSLSYSLRFSDRYRHGYVVVEIFTGSRIQSDTACRINSSSTYRDSIEEYMALMRKCVDTSKN